MLREYDTARENYERALQMDEAMGREHYVKILQQKLAKLTADEAPEKDE